MILLRVPFVRLSGYWPFCCSGIVSNWMWLLVRCCGGLIILAVNIWRNLRTILFRRKNTRVVKLTLSRPFRNWGTRLIFALTLMSRNVISALICALSPMRVPVGLLFGPVTIIYRSFMCCPWSSPRVESEWRCSRSDTKKARYRKIRGVINVRILNIERVLIV